MKLCERFIFVAALKVPDLYIRQIREMKVLTLFEEISSLRLYRNSTLVFSLGYALWLCSRSCFGGSELIPNTLHFRSCFHLFSQRHNCDKM